MTLQGGFLTHDINRDYSLTKFPERPPSSILEADPFIHGSGPTFSTRSLIPVLAVNNNTLTWCSQRSSSQILFTKLDDLPLMRPCMQLAATLKWNAGMYLGFGMHHGYKAASTLGPLLNRADLTAAAPACGVPCSHRKWPHRSIHHTVIFTGVIHLRTILWVVSDDAWQALSTHE